MCRAGLRPARARQGYSTYNTGASKVGSRAARRCDRQDLLFRARGRTMGELRTAALAGCLMVLSFAVNQAAAATCDSLASLALPRTAITLANLVDAGAFTPYPAGRAPAPAQSARETAAPGARRRGVAAPGAPAATARDARARCCGGRAPAAPRRPPR